MTNARLFCHAVTAALLTLLPVAAITPSGPAFAASAAAADPAYADLIAAIEESVDQDVVIDNALTALRREFAETPEFAAAEAASPGVIAEVVAGMRPILVEQNERVTALYRPEMVALLANRLTPEEATSIAAFYRSASGRKLIGNVASAYSPDATLSNIESDGPITADQVGKDINSAVNSAIEELSEEERRKMTAEALNHPALFKLLPINPGIQAIRVKMENEPLTPSEEAAVVALIESIFDRRFGQ
jgi:hypothetical protein